MRSKAYDQPQERFTKILRKLNSSTQQIQYPNNLHNQTQTEYQNKNSQGSGSVLNSIYGLNKSEDNSSFIVQQSIQSSQHSTKNTSHIKNPLLAPPKIQSITNPLSQPSTFQTAISTLLQPHQVLINRIRNTIRTEFIPTSNGLRSILILQDGNYVNLSWVHSVQQLEKTKILILYYELQRIKNGQKPQIVSLVVEFVKQSCAIEFLRAVEIIHQRWHDPDVQKLYHQLSS